MNNEYIENVSIQFWKLLIRKNNWENNKFLQGHGTLSPGAINDFVIHLYTEEKEENLLQSPNSEGFYSDEECLSILATDVNGNVWRADGGWIISDSKSSIRTVKISISEIFQEKRLDFSFDCSQIQFHFLGKQDFPCNSKTITKKTINNEERISSTNFNVAQLESEIGTFEFEKNDYGFSLNWVLGKKIVNKYKINRVESCLEFVFSKTFNLVKTTELFENVEITKLYPIKKKHETSLSFL